ncbi:MAG: hypothetical protein IT385_13935 [Deltaproteobacteria bacterium]|nr:hypothetical protein [Deltaproteobacteria bacterium]
MPDHAAMKRATGGASALALMVLCALVMEASCKDDDADDEPSVEDIVAASMRHEGRLLELLEHHQDRPAEARRLVRDYVAAHAAELDGLASRRALLERQPAAVASALERHRALMAQNFERRRRLLERAPTLMADPVVRDALGRLAAL